MNKIIQRFPEVTEKIRRELGDYAFQTYRGQVPVSKPRPGREKVGTLRDSVFLHYLPNGFVVGAGALHAKYPAYGTKPHVILPRGERLSFWWDKLGKWVFPRIVHHPGQKKNPFHARVAHLVRLRAQKLVKQITEELIRR